MSLGGNLKDNNKYWKKLEKSKKNISADNFLVEQVHIAGMQTQNFANNLEKDYKFDKGTFIMIYFYIYTYMLIFSLKKDYPVKFTDWVEEELTESYIQSINSEITKNKVRDNYKRLKNRYDTIFQNKTPNPEFFAKDIINLLFNEKIDAILNLIIFKTISSHFVYIIETINKYKIIL